MYTHSSHRGKTNRSKLDIFRCGRLVQVARREHDESDEGGNDGDVHDLHDLETWQYCRKLFEKSLQILILA